MLRQQNTNHRNDYSDVDHRESVDDRGKHVFEEDVHVGDEDYQYEVEDDNGVWIYYESRFL